MGLLDYVHCEKPLPDGWQPEGLQTKDFDDPYLKHYTITADGRLMHQTSDINYHGWMRFYGIEGSQSAGQRRWHEYMAKFTDGQLQSIDLVKNEPL